VNKHAEVKTRSKYASGYGISNALACCRRACGTRERARSSAIGLYLYAIEVAETMCCRAKAGSKIAADFENARSGRDGSKKALVELGPGNTVISGVERIQVFDVQYVAIGKARPNSPTHWLVCGVSTLSPGRSTSYFAK